MLEEAHTAPDVWYKTLGSTLVAQGEKKKRNLHFLIVFLKYILK